MLNLSRRLRERIIAGANFDFGIRLDAIHGPEQTLITYGPLGGPCGKFLPGHCQATIAMDRTLSVLVDGQEVCIRRAPWSRRGQGVCLGIEAPKTLPVHREEVVERILAERDAAKAVAHAHG